MAHLSYWGLSYCIALCSVVGVGTLRQRKEARDKLYSRLRSLVTELETYRKERTEASRIEGGATEGRWQGAAAPATVASEGKSASCTSSDLDAVSSVPTPVPFPHDADDNDWLTIPAASMSEDGLATYMREYHRRNARSTPRTTEPL